MNILISSKKRCLLIGIGFILIATITILSYAKALPTGSLSIEPVKALYRQRDTGDFFQIVLAIINSGKKEVTVVTEHLDCGFLGIDKDTNSLRCFLSFDAEIKYKNEYLTVPSIYKYAPVTLKPGEVAIVNYNRDYSTVLNAKGMSEKDVDFDRKGCVIELSGEPQVQYRLGCRHRGQRYRQDNHQRCVDCVFHLTASSLTGLCQKSRLLLGL